MASSIQRTNSVQNGYTPIAQSLLLGLQLIDGVHVLCTHILHGISCRILSSAATDRVLVNGVTVNHYNTRFFVSGVSTSRSCPALRYVSLFGKISSPPKIEIRIGVVVRTTFLRICFWYILCIGSHYILLGRKSDAYSHVPR